MDHGYKYARRCGLKHEDAQDYSQWLELLKLEGKNHFNCINKIIDFRRLKRNWRAVEFNERPGVFDIAKDNFNELTETLNERDKIILGCKFIRGMTLEEIAKAMGLSFGRVSQLTNHALIKLKHDLF